MSEVIPGQCKLRWEKLQIDGKWCWLDHKFNRILPNVSSKKSMNEIVCLDSNFKLRWKKKTINGKKCWIDSKIGMISSVEPLDVPVTENNSRWEIMPIFYILTSKIYFYEMKNSKIRKKTKRSGIFELTTSKMTIFPAVKNSTTQPNRQRTKLSFTYSQIEQVIKSTSESLKSDSIIEFSLKNEDKRYAILFDNNNKNNDTTNNEQRSKFYFCLSAAVDHYKGNLKSKNFKRTISISLSSPLHNLKNSNDNLNNSNENLKNRSDNNIIDSKEYVYSKFPNMMAELTSRIGIFDTLNDLNILISSIGELLKISSTKQCERIISFIWNADKKFKLNNYNSEDNINDDYSFIEENEKFGDEDDQIEGEFAENIEELSAENEGDINIYCKPSLSLILRSVQYILEIFYKFNAYYESNSSINSIMNNNINADNENKNSLDKKSKLLILKLNNKKMKESLMDDSEIRKKKRKLEKQLQFIFSQKQIKWLPSLRRISEKLVEKESKTISEIEEQLLAMKFPIDATLLNQIRLIYDQIITLFERERIQSQMKTSKEYKEYIYPYRKLEMNDEERIIHYFVAIRQMIYIAKGFHPNVTQLVVAIALILKQYKGKFANLFSGEGKSLIIAMVAIYLSSTGQNVDIISTNQQNAKQDLEEYFLLFKLCKTTATHCCVDLPKADEHFRGKIVYGTLSSFQSAFLRDSFLSTPTFRGKRKYQVVIIEEVDQLLNTKLSSGNIRRHPLFDRIQWVKEKIISFYQENVQFIDLITFIHQDNRYIETSLITKKLIDRVIVHWNEMIRFLLFDNQNVQPNSIPSIDPSSFLPPFLIDEKEFTKRIYPTNDRVYESQISNGTYIRWYSSVYGFGEWTVNADRVDLSHLYSLESFDVPSPSPSPSSSLSSPSLFSSSSSLEAYSPIFCRKEGDWLSAISEEAIGEASKNRSVFIICFHVFHLNLLLNLLNDYDKVQIIEYSADGSSNYNDVMRRSILPSMITILTIDDCRDRIDLAHSLLDRYGGLHLIISFFPSLEQEEKRLITRFGKGSFRFIFNLDHLSKSNYRINFNEEYFQLEEFNQQRRENYLLLTNFRKEFILPYLDNLDRIFLAFAKEIYLIWRSKDPQIIDSSEQSDKNSIPNLDMRSNIVSGLMNDWLIFYSSKLSKLFLQMKLKNYNVVKSIGDNLQIDFEYFKKSMKDDLALSNVTPDPYFLLERGEFLFYAKNFELAKWIMEEVIQIDSSSSSAATVLAVIEFTMKENKTAEEKDKLDALFHIALSIATNNLRSNPNMEEDLLNQLIAYKYLNEINLFNEQLEKIIKLIRSSNDSKKTEKIAEKLSGVGMRKEAGKCYKYLLLSSNLNDHSLSLLCYYYLSRAKDYLSSDPLISVEKCNKVLKLIKESNDIRAEAFAMRSDAQTRLHLTKEAIEDMKQANTINPFLYEKKLAYKCLDHCQQLLLEKKARECLNFADQIRRTYKHHRDVQGNSYYFIGSAKLLLYPILKPSYADFQRAKYFNPGLNIPLQLLGVRPPARNFSDLFEQLAYEKNVSN